ncbi:hypothetical protein HFP70_35415 [Streptomyces sp. ARC14]|uniref:hypothetical protein n=1 Tax=Streptomyces sp. ARC14 TaxID=2724152 RepID=UPI0038573484
MPTTPDADLTAKWQRLADALNDLDNDGFGLMFGNRMGPETNWESVPFAYSVMRSNAPCTVWDRKKKKWVVETR